MFCYEDLEHAKKQKWGQSWEAFQNNGPLRCEMVCDDDDDDDDNGSNDVWSDDVVMTADVMLNPGEDDELLSELQEAL